MGYVNPTSGTINVLNLRNLPRANRNETINKSFATDEDGGVYILSDYALYRFDIGPGGTPHNTWRSAYNRGRREKLGQNQQGSGTTPTSLTTSPAINSSPSRITPTRSCT